MGKYFKNESSAHRISDMGIARQKGYAPEQMMPIIQKQKSAELYPSFMKELQEYAGEVDGFLQNGVKRFSAPNVKAATEIKKSLIEHNNTSAEFATPIFEIAGNDLTKPPYRNKVPDYMDYDGDGSISLSDANYAEKVAAGKSDYIQPYQDNTEAVAGNYAIKRDELNAKRDALRDTFSKNEKFWKELGLDADSLSVINNILNNSSADTLAGIASDQHEYWGSFDQTDIDAYNLNREYMLRHDFRQNSYKPDYESELESYFAEEKKAYEKVVYEGSEEDKYNLQYATKPDDRSDAEREHSESYSPIKTLETSNDSRLIEAMSVFEFLDDPRRKTSLSWKNEQAEGKAGLDRESIDEYETFDSSFMRDDWDYAFYDLANQRKSLFYVNDTEVDIARYIYNTEGASAMLEYLDKLEPALNKRRTQRQQTDAKLLTDEYGGWAVAAMTLGQLPYSLASGVGLIGDLVGKGIDPNSDFNYFANQANAYTGAAQQHIADKTDSKLLTTAYGLGTSIYNFFVTSGLSGIGGLSEKAAKHISLNIMSSGAATNKIIEAKNKGLSDAEAIGMGLVAYGAEYLAENISWNALFSDKSGGALKYILRNARDEGLEEVITNGINDFGEFFIRKGENQWTDMYNTYLKEGKSKEDANKAVFLTALDEYLQAGIGGAVSGGVSGGVVLGGGALMDNITARTTDYDGDIKAFTDMLKFGLESNSNGKLYKVSQSINRELQNNIKTFKSEGMDASQAYNKAVSSISQYDVAKLNKLAFEENERIKTAEREVQGDKQTASYGVENVKSESASQQSLKKPLNKSVTKAVQADVKRVAQQNTSDVVQTDISKATVTDARKYGFAVALADSTNVGIVGVADSKNGNVMYLTHKGQTVKAADMKLEGAFMHNAVEYIEQQGYSAQTAGAFLKSATLYEGRKGSAARAQEFGNAFDALVSSAQQKGTTLQDAANDIKLVQAIHSIGADAAQVAIKEGLRQHKANQSSSKSVPTNKNTTSDNTKTVRNNRKAKVEIKPDVEGKVNSNVKTVLQKMSELGNMKIVVENFKKGDKSRGYYSNGEIHLNARKLRNDYFVKVAIHEAVHHVKANNIDGYAVLEKYVTEYLKNKGEDVDVLINEIIENRKSHGEKLDRTGALEELVANALSDITTDAGALEVFLNLNSKERTKLREVLEGIAARIKEFARKLTGVESRILIKDADVLKKFAKELSAQLDTAGKQSQKNTADSGAKYSFIGIDNNGVEVYETSEFLKNLTYKEKIEIFKRNFYEENSPHYLGEKIRFQYKGQTRYAEINRFTQNKITGKINPKHINQWDKPLINLGADGDFVTLLETSLYDSVKENKNLTKNDAHKRTQFFEYYLKSVMVDDVKYDVVIDVSLEHNGKRFVYDVNLKKIKDSQLGPQMTHKNEYRRPQVVKTPRLSESLDKSLSQLKEAVKKNSFADEEYLAAVEREDIETAQALVDEAAERKFRNSKARGADGKLIKLYHGTESDVFYEFDKNRRGQTDSSLWGRGYYFSSDSEFAEDFGDNVQSFVLNITNPFVVTKVDALASEVADKLIALGESIDFDYSNLKAHEFANHFGNQKFTDVLTSHGYDGVIIDNFEYVTFDTNQMKLSDAVIYDDNGKAIPISERFSEDKSDFRYSFGDEEVDLWGLLDPEDSGSEEASDLLRGYIETANKVLEVSRNINLKDGTVRQMANSILRQYTGRYNTESAERIELILDAASRNPNVSGAEVVGEIAAVVKDAVLRSEYSQDMYAGERAEVFAVMKGFKRVYLTQEQIDTLEDNDRSINWFRQKMLGKVGVTAQGQFSKSEMSSFESLYRQLMEMYPEHFEEVSSNNMPLELFRVLEGLKPKYVSSADFFRQSDDVTAVQIAGELFGKVIDAKYKNTHNKKIQELKTKLADDKKNWIAEQEKSGHAKNVEKYAKSMLRWIDKPTKKQSVPEVMKDCVKNFLEDLNDGKDIAAGMMIVSQKLLAIEETQLAKMQSGEFEMDASFIDITPGLAYTLEEFANKHSGKSFKDLDGRAVGTLDGLLLALRNTLSSTNRMYQNMLSHDVAEVAEDAIADFEKKKSNRFRDVGYAKTGMEKLMSKLDNSLVFSTADAFTFQKMLGKAGESVMQELWEGYEKFIDNVDAIRKWTDENIDVNKVKKWCQEVHKVKLKDGTSVTLSATQIMELYALAKRKQAQGHIYGYGVVFERNLEAEKENRKDKDKSVYTPEPYILTVDDVVNITSKLSKEQTEVADKMQKYLTEDIAALGNEVMMKRYLFKPFVTKNYWPIKVYGSVLKTTENMLNPFSLYAVSNPGFSKQTQEGANNPIVVDDIFTTFSKHCGQMAMLNGMSIPLSDALKWYNYTNGSKNLKDAMKNALSKHANEWFIKFLSDLNNQNRQKPSGTELAELLVRSSKAASIWGNARVVLQQFSAYTRAYNVLDARYLVRMSDLKIKSGMEKALKYCPVAKWKNYGFFTTDIGNSLENIILPVDTAFDKFKSAGFWAAGKADEITWGILWNACENQVLGKNPQVQKNSEEHMRLTAELLTQVVNETQVVDSPFHRSQIRRSTDLYSTLMSSFMDEPIKSFNMIRNSIKAGKPVKAVFRSVVAFTVTAVFCAALESLWDLIRNSGEDDEDETFFEKYSGLVFGNLWDNVKPWSFLPITNKIGSMIEGFSSAGLDENGVKALSGALSHWIKRFTDDDYSRTLYADLYETAKAFSYLTGIGAHNVIRDTIGIVNLFRPDGMEITTQPVTKTKLAQEAVSALLDGNTELYSEYYNDILEKCGGSESEAERALYNALSKTEIARMANDAKDNLNHREYNRIVDELIEKGFSLDVVIKATNSIKAHYNNQIAKLYEAKLEDKYKTVNDIYEDLVVDLGFDRDEVDEDLADYTENYTEPEDEGELRYEVDYYTSLLDAGMSQEYTEVYSYLIENGVEKSSIKSGVTRKYKESYFNAWMSGNDSELKRIKDKLSATGLYVDKETKESILDKTCIEWLVAELKKSYLSSDDPNERAEIRTKLWQTRKWDDLAKLDEQIAKWVEKDKG